MFPRSVEPSPLAQAWVQGVIDTVFATFDGLAGRSDGKVYHKLEPGSEEEAAWASGCAWTARRLMEGAMAREELRGEAGSAGSNAETSKQLAGQP